MIWWILTWALKILRISTMITSFYARYITFDLKKSRWVIFRDNDAAEWYKIWRTADLWFGKWYKEHDKFSLEHLANSKLGFWWDPFIQSRKCMSLKFTEEFCVITMKNDARFEEELTCRFKIDTTIWQILIRIFKCLKNLHFNWLLLTKVYNFCTKKRTGAMFRGTEDWCNIWGKADLYFPKWQIFTGWKIVISF